MANKVNDDVTGLSARTHTREVVREKEKRAKKKTGAFEYLRASFA